MCLCLCVCRVCVCLCALGTCVQSICVLIFVYTVCHYSVTLWSSVLKIYLCGFRAITSFLDTAVLEYFFYLSSVENHVCPRMTTCKWIPCNLNFMFWNNHFCLKYFINKDYSHISAQLLRYKKAVTWKNSSHYPPNHINWLTSEWFIILNIRLLILPFSVTRCSNSEAVFKTEQQLHFICFSLQTCTSHCVKSPNGRNTNKNIMCEPCILFSY